MTEHVPHRTVSAGGIIVVGWLTVFAHLYHLVIEQSIHAQILGVLIPLGFSILLIGAGIRFYYSEFDEPGTRRVVTWTGVGLIAGGVFGYPVVPYQAAHGIPMIDTPFLVVNWMTTGALAGFLIGVYDARQRKYHTALEAERTELATREQELKRQNERLGQFASVISHDLRNPLNVAMGRLDLAMQDTENEHLDAARTALERMETLIEEVLTLARQGQPIGETEPVTLSEVANQCWMVVDTKEATLQLERDVTFKADADRLQQLLGNLFRNAIDHGDDTVTIRVGALADQSGFYVADDGPGIPDDEREEVFAPGYSTTETGTGLGLAIITEIVDAHDWDIRVTESDASGARFEISGIDVAK